MFHGVKIGEVTEIQLRFNPKDLTAVISVYTEIDPRKFIVPEQYQHEKEELTESEKYGYIKPLIRKGFKAQLQTQSFVTGQLMINLDFYPDKPIKMVGLEKKYPEIPTIPTTMEELTKTIAELPLKEIVTKLELTIDGIQKLVNSPETKEGIESLNVTLKNTQKLVQHIDEQVDPMMKSFTKTSEAAHDTLVQVKSTVSTLNGTLKSTQDTLKQAEKTLEMYSEDSRMTYELNRTLKELSAASRSMKYLSDYLERHPEALLRGKNQE
jgi:paraquat-inducible protein B